MHALMFLHVFHVRKPFAAFLAREILLARMYPHVFLQIKIVSDHFMAHRTLDGQVFAYFVDRAQVTSEALFEREFSTANLALKHLLDAVNLFFVIESYM